MNTKISDVRLAAFVAVNFLPLATAASEVEDATYGPRDLNRLGGAVPAVALMRASRLPSWRMHIWFATPKMLTRSSSTLSPEHGALSLRVLVRGFFLKDS